MIETNGFYGDCIRVLIVRTGYFDGDKRVEMPLVVRARPVKGEFIDFGPLRTVLATEEQWKHFGNKVFVVDRVMHEHGYKENVFSIAVHVSLAR